jgi:hypothetical protein
MIFLASNLGLLVGFANLARIPSQATILHRVTG